MARIFDHRTLLNACTAAALLSVASGGVFFILAPYQANRIREEIVARFHARGDAPLVLATAEEAGSHHALGEVLRRHLDTHHGYGLEVKTTTGSVENLNLLKEGGADLALVESGLGTDQEGLTALANLGRRYVHVVVPADSNVEAFRDLAGKRIGVGPEGSGAAALADRVLDFFHFGEETTLVYDHNPDLTEAFLDGEIDGAFTVHDLFDASMESLLGLGWYRLVPVREAEAVARYLPGVFAEPLPPHLYGPDRSIPSADALPFQTLSMDTVLVCSRRLPGRQVHTVLDFIFQGDFLQEARLTGLSEVRAREGLHLPLHAGAEAFYKRRDPISADRVESVAIFLTGVAGLVGVFLFLNNRRRVQAQAAHRKAIRPYFDALMDFGDEVESAGNPAKLTRLVHKMMATQRGAERKWLEGAFDTGDMEQLYTVYGLRCENAYHKIFDLHLQALRGLNSVEPSRADKTDELPDYVKPQVSAWSARHHHDDTADSPSPTETPPYVAPRTYGEPSATGRVESDDDSFFSGSALAGIDRTKGEIAERLPSRYDPGLLYDTEASGAGSVRVRKSKPQADLQAVVDKVVVEKAVVEKAVVEKAKTRKTVSEKALVEGDTPEGPIPPESMVVPAPHFLNDDPFAEVPAPVEPEEESGPDQLMLF